jgi:hypothetical protein
MRLDEEDIELTYTPDGYIVPIAGYIPRKGIRARPDRLSQIVDQGKRKRGGTAYGTGAGTEEVRGCSLLLWKRKA